MKKSLVLLALIAAAGVAVFGAVGYAQAATPDPIVPGGGWGNGRGGYAGDGTGVPMQQSINLDGAIDDDMAAYLAEALGITVEELKAREAAGETLVEIGLSLGFDEAAIFDLHIQARKSALAQAVADGVLTQEQADWMLSRLDVMGAGYGPLSSTCTGDCSFEQMQTQTFARRGMGGRFGAAPATP